MTGMNVRWFRVASRSRTKRERDEWGMSWKRQRVERGLGVDCMHRRSSSYVARAPMQVRGVESPYAMKHELISILMRVENPF